MTAAKRGRTERLQIIVAADELGAIDDFRFRSRMPSRAAAVRELLRRGLASAGRRKGAREPNLGAPDGGAHPLTLREGLGSGSFPGNDLARVELSQAHHTRDARACSARYRPLSNEPPPKPPPAPTSNR